MVYPPHTHFICKQERPYDCLDGWIHGAFQPDWLVERHAGLCPHFCSSDLEFMCVYSYYSLEKWSDLLVCVCVVLLACFPQNVYSSLEEERNHLL